jgi:hemolysin activation/secretion protein
MKQYGYALRMGVVWALLCGPAFAQGDIWSDVKDIDVRQLASDLYNMGLKDAALRVIANYRESPQRSAVTKTPASAAPSAVVAEPAAVPAEVAPALAPASASSLAKPQLADPVSATPPASATTLVLTPPPSVAPVEPAVYDGLWNPPEIRGVELLRDTGARIQLEQFVFNKTNVASEAELQKLLADLVGKELDHDKLLGATTRINNFYKSRGFLARAVLPAQSLEHGVAKIVVLESRPKFK